MAVVKAKSDPYRGGKYRAVRDKFKIKKIGPKKVKGRIAEIMVYEVI